MGTDEVHCPDCGKDFPTMSALDEHREIVNGLKNTSLAADSDLSNTVDEQGPVTCQDCGQTFNSELLLKWHREAVHKVGVEHSQSTSAKSDPQRTFNRRAGCVMYSLLSLAIIILGLVFHWEVGWIVASLFGTVIVYVITLSLDESEADWKEKTSAEFKQNWETPPAFTKIPTPRLFTSLTSQQEARFAEFVDNWRQIGLSTAPADRSAAEQAIATVYETADLNPPKLVWCMSPLANGLCRAMAQRLTGRMSQPAPLTNEETFSLRRSDFTAGRQLTADELWELAKSRVTTSVSDVFWESVRQSVDASKVERIGGNIEARVRGPSTPYGYDDERDFYQYRKSNWDIAEYLVRGAAGDDIWEKVWYDIETSVANSVDRVFLGVAVGMEDSVRVTNAESRRDKARAKERDFTYTGEIDVEDWSTPDFTRVSRKKVKVQVQNSLGESEEDSIGNSVRASDRSSCHGQHDAAPLAKFAYFRSVCGLVTQTDRLKGQWELAQAAGWYLPHEHICWISERPNVLYLNDQNRLHCETGPAVAYPDGWGIYALNGVIMKAEHVLAEADSIDPQVILKERNVDIRRELLRKVGISRMLRFGKVVDRLGDYKLIDMSPIFKGGGIQYAPYLLMQSASLDSTQYLEGVSPECRTVEQAINWRASAVAKTWTPDLLS